MHEGVRFLRDLAIGVLAVVLAALVLIGADRVLTGMDFRESTSESEIRGGE